MAKSDYHIFICSSSRVAGEPKGMCQGHGSPNLISYIQEELNDRGLDGVMLSNTGCMKRCEKGPVMVIYPPGWWYSELDEEKIDRILDGLEENAAVGDLLLP